MRALAQGKDLPRFSRDAFGSGPRFTCLGLGPIGGKAAGLLRIRDLVDSRAARGGFPGFDVSIPSLVVLCADLFDSFLDRNGLRDLALSEESDRRIASAFLRAELPAEIVGDLRGIVAKVRTPLAVRSSSLLEDALDEPFAGVYGTKMIPNDAPDPDARFRRLTEAIKFVYASTFFRSAKSYVRATRHALEEERMAVLLQEVVGRRHGPRFYPDLSGVARSYNFYPMDGARPEEGVACLALGLGKTVVDGEPCWIYSPAHPRSPPPFGSLADRLARSQTTFWAVNMGEPPAYDPMNEVEYLVRSGLADAEADGVLGPLVSTYDAASDRLSIGTASTGPRLLDFSPLLSLDAYPLNPLLKDLLAAGRETLGAPVEIEFAATFPGEAGVRGRFGFLQVRAMAVDEDLAEVDPRATEGDPVLAASARVLGNGSVESIRDVVHVRPERFDLRHSRAMATEIEAFNASLVKEGRPYLLAGFGRFGSADPWLGIPVEWGQISGAKAILEAALPGREIEFSQGSHFFHNLTSFKVPYFWVPSGGRGVDWEWLSRQPAAGEGEFVRHVALASALRVRVDGRRGRGIVLRPR